MAKRIEKVVYHFDHRDNQLGVLQQMSDCFREFDVSKATDTLTVQTRTFVDKHDRLVVQGRNGRWLEYIVEGPSDDDSGEGGTYVGELSLNELGGHYIDNRRPTGDCATMVGIALEGTRWESLGSDIRDDAVTQVWYHTNSLAALTRIASTFGGEIRYEYEVDGGRVVRRKVGVFHRVGADRGRSFEYGRDLLGVSRECEPEPIYTRVYGYGSGVEAVNEEGESTGGYTRKITFAEVNGGKPYIENDEARQRYGVPNAEGGMDHYEGKVEFDDCKEPTELLRLTTEWAEAQWEPQWSYTVDVLALDGEPLDRGDDATVYDRMYDPVLTIKERVVKGHEDYLRPERDEYTLGKVSPMVSDMMVEQEQAQQQLADRTDNLGARADGWDETSETVETMPGSWLRQQMDRLNQEFNSAGECYKFTSMEKGDIWANGPLTEDGRPDGDTDHAVNICSLGLRVAKDVREGDFDYTTFITGDGATASCVNVGTLRCGDNFLNLDTGEMHLALTATVGVGSTSLSGYVQNVSNTAADNAKREVMSDVNDALEDYVADSEFESHLTMRNVASALTNGFKDKGLFIDAEENAVVFNGDYVRTGVIEASNGLSFFDLDHGFLEAVGNVTSVGQRHVMHSRLVNGQLDLIMDQTPIGSLATYTRSNNANVHITGLKAFTTLVLAGPGIGVSSDSTVSSGLTWTDCIDGTINHMAGVTVNGSTATFDMWSATFNHGLLTRQSNTADVGFDLGTSSVNLLASVDPVDEVRPGEPMQVVQLTSQDELTEAAAQRRMVWVEGEEAGTLAEPVYTGEEWTMDVPKAHESEPVVVPLADFVSAQADAMQSEIEAIAGALGDAIGTAKAKALQTRIATVKTAMRAGEAEAMRTAATLAAARTEAM